MRHLFTSESVTEGHPDKICDQISDSILDAILAQDPDAHVACECATTTGMVLVMGEITTSAYVPIDQIVRSKVVDAPYVDECPLVLECELQATLELGSHTQFVGRILNVGIESDCLNESGQPDMYRIDPLLYDGGQKQYCRVGEPLGKAFSLGRQYGL